MPSHTYLDLLSHTHPAILSVPLDALKYQTLRASDNIQVYEGAAGNLPDANAMHAAEAIKHKVKSLDNSDVLFVLITGGGSALLPLPIEPITLDAKCQLIKQLSRVGATINELNTVRIAISQVKGGKIARMAKNAHRIVSFILSDIVGDPIELIASGPTIHPLLSQQQSEQSPRDILEKYNLFGSLSPSIYDVMMANDAPAKPQSQDNCHAMLIGNNQIAIEAAMAKAREYNLIPVFMSSKVQGDVAAVAGAFFQLALLLINFPSSCTFDSQQQQQQQHHVEQIENLSSILSAHSNFANDLVAALEAVSACNEDDDATTDKAGICIISGGETTVKVSGDGLGGRNQELALRFTQHCLDHCAGEEASPSSSSLNDLLLLSAGTDGLDGNNEAAGAIGGLGILASSNGFSASTCSTASIISEFLNRNDSFNFYRNYASDRYHIITGHTGTNVMDIHLLVMTRQNFGFSKK